MSVEGDVCVGGRDKKKEKRDTIELHKIKDFHESLDIL